MNYINFSTSSLNPYYLILGKSHLTVNKIVHFLCKRITNSVIYTLFFFCLEVNVK